MIKNRSFIVYSVIIFFLISSISLLTSTLGSTDVGDYAGVAKFFSGDYHAKIRSSHSFLYGVIHFPLFFLVKSFIILKITNLVYLFLIILSTYIISGKSKKVLALILLSPIVWYIGPWINSIQLSSLLFLWGHYFIKRFEKEEKIVFLIISGLLVGLSWVFWDSILFFSLLLAVSFFYNKEFYKFVLFFFSVFVGLIPKLIVDQLLFGFPFYGILRYFFGMVTSIFFKGIYGNMNGANYLLSFILLLILIPISSYKLLSKENLKNKSVIFICLSLFLIFLNFQIRYLLLIYPIILLNLISLINTKQFKVQIIISIILSTLVITPYIVQINHSTNFPEFNSLIINFKNIKIYENEDDILKKDLMQISKDFPNETFLVGNLPDSYFSLAMIYWGKDIKEFVSIEDYSLYIKNESRIFSKTILFNPNIQERRAIWIGGGLNKNENDSTDYSKIKYAISEEKDLEVKNFKLIREYEKLNVFEKNF